MVDVALSWHGLPQYAARLIRGALDELQPLGLSTMVIGTPPEVPVEGMERALGQPITWIDARKPVRWSELELDVPGIFVQSGWAYPALTALGEDVKRAGGRVIGLSDANWRGDFRQLVLGRFAFRARLESHFDAVVVPGREGQRLMAWYGLPKARVRIGMYGADPTLFRPGPPLPERPKMFLFVGRFVAAKGVLDLVEAFQLFDKARPGWRLHLCGSGEQRALVGEHPNILVEDFVQPEDLVSRFQQARFFVLPSRTEPWGLVVHEAVSCGCALVLSDRIGSAADLATPRNSLRFRAGNVSDIVRALHAAADCDDAWLTVAEKESLSLSAQFGPERFGREIKSLVQSFSAG